MKTSNYIAISFFVFLFGGIFVLFLTTKLDPRANEGIRTEIFEKSLDSFSVIVAEARADFRIKSGATSKISNNYHKGETAAFPPYLVRNDTLFVSAFPDNVKVYNVEVSCAKLKCIEGKEKSRITLENFSGDSLQLKLSGAEFRHFAATSSGNVSLRVIADNSNIRISDSSLKNLDIQLIKTEMNVWNTKVTNLSGSMKNSSTLSLGTISKINLEVDSSSNYRLNK